MSDNAFETFQNFAKSVADHLKRSGHPIETFTDDNGNSISGWIFKNKPMAPEDGYLSSDGWREVWGKRVDVLTVDGEIYEYDEYNKDEQISSVTEVRQVRMKGMRQWPMPYLVGAGGKPFSEVVSQLERLIGPS